MQRMKRLKEHLEKLEELTGGSLRTSPRFNSTDCPIENFAPDNTNSKGRFVFVEASGCVTYVGREIAIYELTDSYWWRGLSPSRRRWYNRKLAEWIASRRIA